MAASSDRFSAALRLAGLIALLSLTASLAGCSTINRQENVVANLQEADQQLSLGNMAQAREWCDRAIAFAPDSPETYLGADNYDLIPNPGLISILTDHGDYPDIVHYLTIATAKPPLSGNWQILAALSDAQAHLDNTAGERQAANAEVAAIDKQLASPGSIDTSNTANLLTAKADAEWMAGDQTAALADFGKAIETYPDQAAEAENDEAYNEAVGKINLPQALGLANQAVKAARRADNDEMLAEFLDTRGWVEHQMGNDTAAVNDLDEAVALTPQLGDIAFHLATVYQALGRKEDAIVEFQRDLRLDPSNTDAQRALQALAPPAPLSVNKPTPTLRVTPP